MKRYIQPVVQNTAWPNGFTLETVNLVEAPKGDWVRYADVEPLLYIQGELAELRKGFEVCSASLKAAETDAARYRWLRANPIMAEVLFSRIIMDKWSAEELDAAIDRDRGATDGRAPGD